MTRQQILPLQDSINFSSALLCNIGCQAVKGIIYVSELTKIYIKSLLKLVGGTSSELKMSETIQNPCNEFKSPKWGFWPLMKHLTLQII